MKSELESQRSLCNLTPLPGVNLMTLTPVFVTLLALSHHHPSSFISLVNTLQTPLIITHQHSSFVIVNESE